MFMKPFRIGNLCDCLIVESPINVELLLQSFSRRDDMTLHRVIKKINKNRCWCFGFKLIIRKERRSM